MKSRKQCTRKENLVDISALQLNKKCAFRAFSGVAVDVRSETALRARSLKSSAKKIFIAIKRRFKRLSRNFLLNFRRVIGARRRRFRQRRRDRRSGASVSIRIRLSRSLNKTDFLSDRSAFIPIK